MIVISWHLYALYPLNEKKFEIVHEMSKLQKGRNANVIKR